MSVTLFVIAINDIADCIQGPVIGSLFVDDLAIFARSSRIVNAARMVQLTINKLHKWSQKNCFLFSLEKTKCVHFSRTRGVHLNPTLHLGGRNLPFVESVRFLGMTLDHKLNWREHINTLKVNCLKSLNVLNFLSHVSWGADRTTLILL